MKKLFLLFKQWWTRPLTQRELEEDKRNEELREWMYWAY